jgi:hypothetical protein
VRFLNRFRLTKSAMPASIIQPMGGVRKFHWGVSGRVAR